MARYPAAIQKPSPNFFLGGMTYRFVVLHVMEGTLVGTDAWFANTNSQVSAHFGVGRTGEVHQYVDTKDRAWAESQGNPLSISIECEGRSGDSLTEAQLEAVAALVSWCNTTHGVPLKITDSVDDTGLGWHGMGGAAWGGHPDCPGDPIKAQREAILAAAGATATPAPAVLVKGTVYMTPWTATDVVSSLNAPKGGAWLLTKAGDIYAVNCPDYGAPARHPEYWTGGRVADHLEARQDGGYDVLDTKGERYSYPAITEK